ncbi:MAG: transposase [Acidobacteria bacterium]|nr:MAG: transposase [Acidobacteriota bacterium]
MSRPPRIPGFSYKGCYRYFLTFCTFRRHHFFIDATTVSNTLTQFRQTSQREGFEILAYCFMPDHTHELVEGLHESADLRRFCKLAKQRSGGVHARSGRGPLWQEGYYDRVLRDGEDIRQVARYILNNPIRAGLVNTPADYPYLGSDRWTVAELVESQQ